MNAGVHQALFIVIFISISLETKAVYTPDQIKALAKHCNTTKDDLEILLKYEVPTTESGKCSSNCMMKTLKVISSKGVYNQTATLEALKIYWTEFKDDKLELVSYECEDRLSAEEASKEITSNTCEYGYRVLKCINSKFREPACFQLYMYAVHKFQQSSTTSKPTTVQIQNYYSPKKTTKTKI